MKIATLITTVLLLLISQGVHAKTFYKWTDENGVTHYATQKPRNVDSEEVEIRGGRQTPAQRPEDTAQSTGNQTAERASPEPSTGGGEDSQEAAEDTLDPERCAAARDNLDTLTTYARVRMNSQDGETRYLSEDEKQEQIKQVQAVIDRVCP